MTTSGLTLCGVLTFEGRALPKEWVCGVCQSRTPTTEARCSGCHSQRVAEWQRHRETVLEPGVMIEIDGKRKIITRVDRLRKAFHVVVLDEGKTEILDDVTNVRISECDDFEKLGLCPQCDLVFRVENWRHRNNRERLTARRESLEAHLEELRSEKDLVKSETPTAYPAILHLSAEMKRISSAIADLRRQARPPVVDWCPHCLNRDFRLDR